MFVVEGFERPIHSKEKMVFTEYDITFNKTLRLDRESYNR